MEAAIAQFQTHNRTASVNISPIVDKYILPNSDVTNASQLLELSGYRVTELVDQNPKKLLAEKTICPAASPLTGFCREIRIVLVPDGQSIDSVQAFLFSELL